MNWGTNASFSNSPFQEDPTLYYINNTEEYLALLYGPKRSTLCLPMSLVYAVIFIVGVSGNLLTCFMILKHRNMKTPTNYYLFSLAISDLLVLIFGLPIEVYEMWSNYPFLFGDVGCYFKTSLFETVCFASILNVTTVSVERYVAIVHPLRAKSNSTRERALKIIIVLWVLSVLFSIPNTTIHGIKQSYFPNGTLIPDFEICAVVKPLWIYNLVIQITSLLFYVVPMGVISILYYLMGLKLRDDKSSETNEMNINIQRPSRKSVTKMLFVLVLVFAICWAAFHVDRLFFSFVVVWTEQLANVFNLIHVISGVLLYLSSAVNPIIYNIFSRRFRTAFLNAIPAQCKGKSPQGLAHGLQPKQNVFALGSRMLMDSADNMSPQFTLRTSVCSSHHSQTL
ncbi:neuromedin-U receptor 2 [Latimeria chalumnae]|nr:PREDICTED: neuromedin-U receptor 2 [Latimeria chalumnae]|eukprot:XP_005988392.1 PREDICTED: neuromedin-U receptor 2 [Latimeria chalumnae]